MGSSEEEVRFAILRIYEFMTFSVEWVMLPSQKKMSPRDEQVGRVEFCLVMSGRMYRYVETR